MYIRHSNKEARFQILFESTKCGPRSGTNLEANKNERSTQNYSSHPYVKYSATATTVYKAVPMPIRVERAIQSPSSEYRQ